MKKYYLWGLGIGIVLAVINTYSLGLLGFVFGAFSLASALSDCSGESCWGVGIWIGDTLLIIISLLIAFIIGRSALKIEKK